MVATQFDTIDASCRFLIRPNSSLPWRDAVRFYIAMFTVSFSIALAFAYKGAWLILPFAGLEMMVLGIALYLVALRSKKCWQMILIRGDNIEVVDHASNNEQHKTFQRAWTKVALEQSQVKGYPSRLTIGSHGRCIEIGGCLNEKEKMRLANELNQAVHPSY